MANVEARIRQINPTVAIQYSERCNVPLEMVIDLNAFDLSKILDVDPAFLDTHDHNHDHHHHHHSHDDRVASFSLISESPLVPERFFPWIQSIAQKFGPNLLRMKGIIAFEDDDDRYVTQGIHMYLEGNHQRPWRTNEKRITRIVFIGRDLQREIIEEGFHACIALQEKLAG